MSIQKILIANRGEIALRVIRACKELNIKTVAVYSTADKDSLRIKSADEAYCIGAPQSKLSYLNIDSVLQTAILSKADAIHPGYGFLAENENFARRCEEHNIKFIGPKPSQIAAMGDKITAKSTMIKAKVPVIPGSDGLITDIDAGKKLAEEIGYPIILKATAGGGGKGMRIVWEASEFEENLSRAQTEAGASFGNAGMYLEKYIEEPRHIEVQVAGDQYGNAAHFSERDCSIQRRHQKLVEESPSPFVDDALREKLGKAATNAVKAIQYEGVGTIEFLVDKYKNFYFMEMNTRIQVEHPVTEEVVDVDLIQLQIEIANGKKLEQKAYLPTHHAIECRINAEDPLDNFKPSAGKITNYIPSGGIGVRIDTHIYPNYSIPPFYDSMIAKLIVKAKTRQEAIQKMKRALNEMKIEGIKTTIPFHLKLMENVDFVNGNFTTKFLEEQEFDYSDFE
ncbi:MAG: acetyl-CoA carboxylase biotin carboxylase subunit [Sphingobacteriales bacterium]|nr:MAG: acetyl-CoA carboxylase biotin carboxylase subunit [Sphingobacteriales bacterium]